tara:strand:+ start:32847 stop:34094 length:1248 start_codon:yes stop_codon:yes gene_type:complete
MKKIIFFAMIFLSIGATAQQSIELKVKSKYIHLPVTYNGDDETRLELVVNNKIERAFDIWLADGEPDFWVFLDVSEYKQRKVSIRTQYGDDRKGLSLIYQSDDRNYLKNAYKEKHRPQLHFSSIRGWNNDPNGLIYYDGEYHLFYQHNPYGWAWGNMHWGHAISTDLLHWEQLPEALYPDEIGVAYSGSTVIDYDNTSGFKTGNEHVMVAIYTTTWFPNRDQEKAGRKALETQSLAYSNDKGRTWTKYEDNPVIGDSDGGYILGGHTRSPSYGVVNWDYLLLKVDSDGNEEWHSTFGQPRGYDARYIHDEAYGVRATSDGGFVIAGGSGDEHSYSESGHPKGASDIWKAYIVKVNSQGETIWEEVYGSPNLNNAGEYLGLTSDGGYVIGTDSDSAGKNEFAPNNFGFLKLGPDPE